MSVKKIEEKDFEVVIKNEDKKVLIDCYADWCGPCQMLGPVIEGLSDEIDSVEFYKLNVDEAMEVASKYQIMSIPTLLIFEKGNLKETLVGFKTADELREILK
ncbi:MAG: thioredoxin [Clostridia bacterium]|nr:thioredoxin [Clostridia bacterium]